MESVTIKKMTFLRQISILMVLLAVKLTGDVKYYDISHFYKFICIASFDVTSGNFIFPYENILHFNIFILFFHVFLAGWFWLVDFTGVR